MADGADPCVMVQVCLCISLVCLACLVGVLGATPAHGQPATGSNPNSTNNPQDANSEDTELNSNRSRRPGDAQGTRPALPWDFSGRPLVPPSTTAGEANVASTKLTVEELQARLEAVQNASDLPAELQTEVVRLFNSALGYMRAAELDTQRATSFQDLLLTAPAQTKEIHDDLLAGPTSAPDLPEAYTTPDVTLEVLDRAVTTMRSLVSEAEADLARSEQLLSDERAKPQSLQTRLITKRVRLTEIEEDLASLNKRVAPSLMLEARRAELMAEREATQASMRAIEQERLTHQARLELLTARRDWDKYQVTRLRQELEQLQNLVNTRRRDEATQERRDAERARLDTGGMHEVLQAVATANAKISEQQLATVTAIEITQQKLSRQGEQLSEINAEKQNAGQMIKAASLNEEIGFKLRWRRSELRKDLLQLLSETENLEQKLAETGLNQLLVEEELAKLTDIDAHLSTILFDANVPGPVGDRIRPELRKLLEDRQTLLIKQRDTYRAYVRDLSNLDGKQDELIREASKYADELDEQLLYIRSAQPINRQTFRDAAVSLGWLLSWDNVWAPLVQTVVTRAKQDKVLWSVAGAVYLALLIWSIRLRRYLRSIHQRVGQAESDTFTQTVEAAVITVILALPLPLLILFVAWQIDSASLASTPTQAIAVGASAAMVTFLLLRAFHFASHPHGLFASHFGWTQRTVALLRHSAMLMLVAAVPMRFVLSTLNEHAEANPATGEVYVNSLGRLCFAVVMFLAGLVMLRLLKPSSGIASNLIRQYPDGWLARLRYIWYPSAAGVWFVLGILAGAGYFFTAQQLGSTRLQQTVWLVVGALLAREMLVRWLLVSQRRTLAAGGGERSRFDMTRRRRSDQRSGSYQAAPGRSRPDDTVAADLHDPSLLDAKMHQLLRALLGCTLLVGLWLIWSSVLPALKVMENNYVPGSETISWQQALTALAILAISMVLSRDVPSVLEIAILQRLPLNAGERYAIATISRYLITILGVFYAFAQVQIGWGQVQWLVAAMAVGLGFGLQEIFGNFMSGLIILFEQPIRLGDRVTVGNIVGTVSRIRIRATTITDRDRRELIIPNKEFITGQVINWTLSNPMTRVIIPVGIAYGSDRQKARKLLLEAAQSCPLVVEDPEPEVFFIGFGESSLNFQVRAFVKHVWQRTPSRDAIHENIDQLFREHGVAIPYPQRDLHLRSADVAIASREEEAAATFDAR